MNNTESAKYSDSSSEALKELMRQQIEMLGKWIRPYVIVDVYPRWFVNSLYFRVRNVGQTPAYHVRMTIDPPIPIRNRMSSDLRIFQQPISVLGPNEEMSFFFDSAIELLGEEGAVLQFDVKLQYAGSDSREYERIMPVNIDLLRGLAIELPATDKIIEKLERLEKEIERIARYTDHLYHRELTQACHEPQGEQTADLPEQENEAQD
jgi:hypothetical protein